MRHFRHYHTLAIVAIFALSASVLTTDAWPLRENALESAHQLVEHGTTGGIPSLQKRQKEKDPGTGKPEPTTTDESPKPTTTQDTTKSSQTQQPTTRVSTTDAQPKPTTTVAHTTAQAPKPAPSSHGTSGSAQQTVSVSGSNSGVLPTGSGSGSPTSPEDGEGVPTKVSHKVLIGIGTVGGMIVFALGGLAFCRHRRKKNLAKALLQQTAQFNNNNPYAKLSEAGTPAKESLPMTPTKPLGSCNAVSAYMPALADEIEIGIGESVTILQEYDDGWCLGVNNSRNGIKGVFPRYCLEGYYDPQYAGNAQGGGGPGYYPPEQGFKAMNKRMSSIPPGGWNNGPPVYNGGGGYNGDYPSNPNQQYQGQGGQGGQGFYNQGGY
ncbi:hypothetical protein BGZ65_010870 [Modicella reniformis]|uniref:SH3 domain-containing protein n=1 Tax=Modicella reniformis TaxID=1440133 RepID=A0A9P6SRH9_9FUNG|nr:hypothetical protein BGZ65_010870 [Modicella reniformis]